MNFDIEAEQSWHDTKSIVCQEIWSAICFKIMTRYTCGFFPRILAIIPATRYTCVFLSRILAFFPALWGFYSQVYDHFLTNAHIYAHQKAHICVTNKHVVYAVTESRRIRGTELYRQPKTPSCTMELKGNFGLTQLISFVRQPL